jgi:hypothetical protein
VSADHLAADEALSPELVLVLSPALRAQALARLGPPVWPAPRLRLAPVEAPVVDPFDRSLGQILVSRVIQLGATFVAATLLTIAMAIAAHALR